MSFAAPSLDKPQSGKHLADELAALISAASVIRRDEIMAGHTTLRVGGPADVFAEPANETDLSAILNFCGRRGVNFFILGRGSNLIVRDGGFRGVMIRLSSPEFSQITIDGERIKAGAGAKQKNVAVEARRAGLSGVEFLEGIPGSIGGALRMNAGAMGGETYNVVESVRVMDFAGNIMELATSEMAVGYRSCLTLKHRVALSAMFKCTPAPREEIEARMKAHSERRWSSQPAAPSAGCMFKNPAAIPAGRLIDQLGLKGAKVGAARVSLEHGNFLVNDGGATAKEVLALIGLLQAKAKAERGVELHPEVEIIGDDD